MTYSVAKRWRSWPGACLSLRTPGGNDILRFKILCCANNPPCKRLQTVGTKKGWQHSTIILSTPGEEHVHYRTFQLLLYHNYTRRRKFHEMKIDACQSQSLGSTQQLISVLTSLFSIPEIVWSLMWTFENWWFRANWCAAYTPEDNISQ